MTPAQRAASRRISPCTAFPHHQAHVHEGVPLPEIPRLKGDRTRALYQDPYGFIASNCQRLGTDVFHTRILMRPTLCMTGPEMARLVYDPAWFQRQQAAPRRVRRTLLGNGGVQSLDGEAHRHRKALLLHVLSEERVRGLVQATGVAWAERVQEWPNRDEIVLYDEAKDVLGHAVCRWAGIPADTVTPQRLQAIASLFEGAGLLGPGHWRARRARPRLERWLGRLVRQVRRDHELAPEGTALRDIAEHHELDGNLLPPRVAAVELLNLLRPTMAVSVYVTFIAHALHAHPEQAMRLRADPPYARPFVQEVRRTYPFFPAVMAKVRRGFAHNGYTYAAGMRVLLDIHGTNRDPRTWDEPDAFRPERFTGRHTAEDPFSFVPQGGGDRATGHRCAGEPLTVAIMEQAATVLCGLEYRLPAQDLTLSDRTPPIPTDGIVLRDVRHVSPLMAERRS